MRTCPNPDCPDRTVGLVSEYLDSITTCPMCGARLIDAGPGDAVDRRARSTEAQASDLELVCVLHTADEAEAALVKSILDAEQITYLVKGELVQDLLGWGRILGGFNYVVGPAEFLVRSNDADRARAALETGGTVTEPDGPGNDE